jgi:hypothetical protein
VVESAFSAKHRSRLASPLLSLSVLVLNVASILLGALFAYAATGAPDDDIAVAVRMTIAAVRASLPRRRPRCILTLSAATRTVVVNIAFGVTVSFVAVRSLAGSSAMVAVVASSTASSIDHRMLVIGVTIHAAGSSAALALVKVVRPLAAALPAPPSAATTAIGVRLIVGVPIWAMRLRGVGSAQTKTSTRVFSWCHRLKMRWIYAGRVST